MGHQGQDDRHTVVARELRRHAAEGAGNPDAAADHVMAALTEHEGAQARPPAAERAAWWVVLAAVVGLLVSGAAWVMVWLWTSIVGMVAG